MRRDEEGLLAPAQDGPQAIAERLLALVTLEPQSERVVRRAWRSAQRLDAELDVLVVRPPGREPSAESRERLEALRRLTSMLGARLRVEEGEDVAERGDHARARARHHLRADGPPRAAPRDCAGCNDSLLTRLLQGLPGVDVRIVADPSLRGQAGDGEPQGPVARGDAGRGQGLSAIPRSRALRVPE